MHLIESANLQLAVPTLMHWLAEFNAYKLMQVWQAVALVKIAQFVKVVATHGPVERTPYPVAHVLQTVALETIRQFVRVLEVHPLDVFMRYPVLQVSQLVPAEVFTKRQFVKVDAAHVKTLTIGR
jgi:hypothetical protein